MIFFTWKTGNFLPCSRLATASYNSFWQWIKSLLAR